MKKCFVTICIALLLVSLISFASLTLIGCGDDTPVAVPTAVPTATSTPSTTPTPVATPTPGTNITVTVQ